MKTMTSDQEFLQELQKEFLDEATFLLEQCEESYLKLENPACRAEELAKIFRLAHSMKGAGAAVGFLDLAGFAHSVEDCLAILRTTPEHVDISVISLLLRCGDAIKIRVEMLKAKSSEPWIIEALQEEVREAIASMGGVKKSSSTAPHAQPPPATPPPQEAVADAMAAETRQAIQTFAQGSAKNGSNASVKIDTDRIDGVLDIVGELVVIKSQLMNRTEAYAGDIALGGVVSLLDKTVRELQDKTLSMRMTPLKSLFLKMQRIVRDTSVKLGKTIDFLMDGEDTEIDRTMVELLSDPLLHIVRNSIDHGIEANEKRKASGKPERGTVSVSSYQAGGRVHIRVQDDGGGINREKVLRKAVEKDLLPRGQDPSKIPDSEVFGLIFAPGFSTADVVSDLSGRGVGLDVVRTNIEKLKGIIDITSKPGQGTTFIISIPLTTSITDGMMVNIGSCRYILPMDGIRDLIEFRPSDITELAGGGQLVKTRGQLVPILPLENILESLGEMVPRAAQAPESRERRHLAVIVEHGSRLLGLQVNAVLGQTQVVLKPLSESLRLIRGLAGAAILGDGQVSLVLDIDGLVKSHPDRAA